MFCGFQWFIGCFLRSRDRRPIALHVHKFCGDSVDHKQPDEGYDIRKKDKIQVDVPEVSERDACESLAGFQADGSEFDNSTSITVPYSIFFQLDGASSAIP